VTYALPLSVLLFAATASSQWRELDSGAVCPSARAFHAIAHFENARATVLVGGEVAGARASDETWVLDDLGNGQTQWRPWTYGTVVTPRLGHTMAVDPSRQKAFLFGGYEPTSSTWLNDLWTFDFQQGWVAQPTTGGPSPRVYSCMAFDTARDRLVVYGGARGSTVYPETWEFNPNNNQWSQIATQTTPNITSNATLLRSSSNVMTLTSGFAPGIGCSPRMWQYNPSVPTWSEVLGSASQRARCDAASAYDPVRHCIVTTGGSDRSSGFQVVDDTVEFRYPGFVRYANSTPPPARFGAACTYDSTARRVLLHGGMTAGFVARDDLFEYPSAPSNGFGAGCPGSNGTPTLAAAPGSQPALGATFTLRINNLPAAPGVLFEAVGLAEDQWNGAPLPLDLSGVLPGASGCSLFVAPDSGLSTLRGHGGGTATVALAIPQLAALSGLTFFVQIGALEPTGPNGGLAVSNATRNFIR